MHPDLREARRVRSTLRRHLDASARVRQKKVVSRLCQVESHDGMLVLRRERRRPHQKHDVQHAAMLTLESTPGSSAPYHDDDLTKVLGELFRVLAESFRVLGGIFKVLREPSEC